MDTVPVNSHRLSTAATDGEEKNENRSVPVRKRSPMSDIKGKVALMMKLPKAERLNQLVAMSQECISRGEDAAPLLELIQMEMDDWETASNASSVASSRPTSVASSAAIRPASSASSAAADPKEKSMRRQLTEKRNELRTMLAQVNAALGEAPLRQAVGELHPAASRARRRQAAQTPAALVACRRPRSMPYSGRSKAAGHPASAMLDRDRALRAFFDVRGYAWQLCCAQRRWPDG